MIIGTLYNEVPGIIWKDEDLGIRRWQEYKGNKIIDNAFVSGPGYVTEAIMDIAQKYRPRWLLCNKPLST